MRTILDAPILAVGKPRMTRRDKWKKRECVLRYRAFADELRLRMKAELPTHGYHVIAYLPMPKSWPKWKKDKMRGKPHQSKPDKDNIEKALCDSLLKDDSGVWDGRVTKLWADEPRLVILDYGLDGRLQALMKEAV